MARGNNQKQSSARSEIGGDRTSRFLNGLRDGFLSGGISSKEEYKKYVRDFDYTRRPEEQGSKSKGEGMLPRTRKSKSPKTNTEAN